MGDDMKRIIIVIIMFLLIITVIVFLYVQNHWLQVSNYSLAFSELPKEFDDYKIVHLSDLHDQTFGENQKKIIDQINAINPDVIVFTGDLIDHRRYDLNTSMDLIHGLVEKYKVYYVTGNHEAWTGKVEEIEKSLVEAGVVVLRNDIETIELNGAQINIIGIDDPDFGNDLPLYELDKFSIMLSHRSELVEYYEASKVNIVFTGHAHGGQFRLFNKGLISPNQGFFPKYTEGVHELGNTKLVISRGLGNSLFPFRIFNRPEIVVVELKKLKEFD